MLQKLITTQVTAQKYTLLPPKTKGSIRKIDVESEVLQALNKFRIQQNEIKMQMIHEWHDHNFVFARIKGPYWGYPRFIKTIENRFDTVLKSQGYRRN
ncbi:hypothetical protein [Bacillus safensis]|uniref:hypothetical protein n=1 Tax=Bacillus safensis TaxID=561879 RepID=UPI001F4E210E|nr:hypothetical protein [Bacillus safensis]